MRITLYKVEEFEMEISIINVLYVFCFFLGCCFGRFLDVVFEFVC